VRALFPREPFVTIFLTNEEKKAFDEMKRKNASAQPQMKPPSWIPMGGAMMGGPMMSGPMMGSPMMMNMPPNMQPMSGFNTPFQGGQFPQPQMYRQPQKPVTDPQSH
jgi:hypothetical protein